MLKFLLCALMFSLCVGCAYWLTRRYKKRKDFFYNLDLFNERLVNEVSYTKIPLPAFAEKYEFTGDFKKMLTDKKDDFQAEKYGHTANLLKSNRPQFHETGTWPHAHVHCKIRS